MPREIVFEIDDETGELSTTVKGVPGKGCEEIASILKEFAGEPVVEENTAEYGQTARAQVAPRTRIGGGK